MSYPQFSSITEMREFINKSQKWGFKEYPLHSKHSPYRKIILSALRGHITIGQYVKVRKMLESFYE